MIRNSGLLVYLILLLLISSSLLLMMVSGNTIDRDNYVDTAPNEIASETKPLKWLKGVQEAITSPTGHVVVQVAKELLNRSAGNSQVLSLNVTNLLIILLLKVLIFSAGLLGAGHWSNYGYGRSNDNGLSFGVNEGEAYLITGFLAAQSGLDDCLYAAACESPTVAYEYAKAAKALIGGLKKFHGDQFMDQRYLDLIVLMEEAAHNGFRGNPCNTTVKCDNIL